MQNILRGSTLLKPQKHCLSSNKQWFYCCLQCLLRKKNIRGDTKSFSLSLRTRYLFSVFSVGNKNSLLAQVLCFLFQEETPTSPFLCIISRFCKLALSGVEFYTIHRCGESIS